MRGILKCLLIGMVCLLFYGCASVGDYDISLSGGYSLIRSSGHMITINKKTGDGVWEEALIPEKVTELVWNEKYILAKQLGLKRKYPDADYSYEVPDESKVSYWILEVANGKVYGPLDEEKFNKKKTELSIPESMILKNISYYN